MTLPQAWLAEFGLVPLWIRRDVQPNTTTSDALDPPVKTQLTVKHLPTTKNTAVAIENALTDPLVKQTETQLAALANPTTTAKTQALVQPLSFSESTSIPRKEAELKRDTLELEALRAEVATCTRCSLSKTRKQTVFGVGDPHADWMFIGEGPGANEDRLGEPFVGQAGKLLDNMLNALGISRQKRVFIANVVKCRPPNNRDPLPDEIAACSSYLLRQVELVKPRMIVALGRFAAQTVLATDAGLGALRNRIHDYHGVPVIVTYHPAYLLRKPADKALVWQDLWRARAEFERVTAR